MLGGGGCGVELRGAGVERCRACFAVLIIAGGNALRGRVIGAALVAAAVAGHAGIVGWFRSSREGADVVAN